ncbi:MAG: rhodanese-like domain-containing protein [Mariprofundaceae bacterium]
MYRKCIWGLIASMFMALSVSACGMGEQTEDGYENTDIGHAYQHWQQGKHSSVPFLFLDVRTTGEYASGHVPGAKLIPIQALAERLAEVPRDKRVYVYCESGVRSAKASKMLAEAGFTNIENIPGSMQGWRNAAYPIEK